MILYFLAFSVLALALGFVVFPFFHRRERADISHLESDVAFDPLLERKQVILQNILDLEFEHRMGKLSDADYLAARGELEEEAVAILDQLEAAPAPLPVPGVCPKCGADNRPSNRFCGKCGAPLEVRP